MPSPVRRPSRRFLLAGAVVAACAGALACGPAAQSASHDLSEDALRSSSAGLAASPNPVQALSNVHLAGCGYAPSSSVSIQDQGPEGTEYWGTSSDASGCISYDHKASAYAGAHTLKAYQTSRTGKASLVAQASLSVTPQPLTVTSESYVFQWDPTKGCIAEDDSLNWQASGYLAPGQSFTFTPQYPDCNDARALMVKVTSTDTGAQLRVSSVVPAADGISNNPSQAGTPIFANMAGGAAALCMFPNTSFTPPANYTITITNTGTTTANNINVTGKDLNDWVTYYWPICQAADADHDGWSDAYEHAMAQLIYPTGNYVNGALPAGSDYLRSCGTGAANDEFDFWPPDLDDDGVVTQADVNLLTAHLGEGNGIPWAQIDPNSDAASFWNHTGAWNRYDLNGDGYVNQADVDLLQSKLGATATCP